MAYKTTVSRHFVAFSTFAVFGIAAITANSSNAQQAADAFAPESGTIMITGDDLVGGADARREGNVIGE